MKLPQDKMSIPAPADVFDYIRRLGWRRALLRGAYVAANQLISLSVFDCLRLGRDDINVKLAELSSRYECRFLDPGEADRFEGQLEGLTARNLRRAEVCGDAVYVVLDGERLANIGFYAAGPTPVQDDLVIHFAPPSRYMYGGYTPVAYRGSRLHALGILRAARELFEQHVPQLVSVCERTNYRAAVSVSRMGWKPCGTLCRVGLGPRNWIGRTATASALGMDLQWRNPVDLTGACGQF